MAKEINLILSMEAWKELQELKKTLKVSKLRNIFPYGYRKEPHTYKEYLEGEKENPTMALFG